MKVFLIVVIVMVVLLLGALGFVVLDKRINGDGAESGDVDTSKGSSRTEKDKEEKKENNKLKDAASKISQVLAEQACNDDVVVSDLVAVDEAEPFVYEKGVSRINKDLNYAYVQYECGSHSGIALMKHDKGEWRLVSSDSREYPLCSSVRDRGFPASVIDKCYESINSREPIAL